MDINHLRAFVSAYNNRSFTKASRELQLRQPTISSHIKTLETEINCKLFDKAGKIVTPTEKADILYRHSVELLQKVDALTTEFGEMHKVLTGHLQIGASTFPGEYLIPPVLSGFRKRYPYISFQVLISDAMTITASIAQHDLIMGVVGDRPRNDQIRYTPLMKDDLIIVASASLIKSDRMTLEEFVRLPVIICEEDSIPLRDMRTVLAHKGLSPDCMKIAGTFNSINVVKQAVKSGLGASIMSKLSVSDELAHNMLKQANLSDIELTRYLYLATHKKRTLPRLYNIFLTYILGELAKR